MKPDRAMAKRRQEAAQLTGKTTGNAPIKKSSVTTSESVTEHKKKSVEPITLESVDSSKGERIKLVAGKVGHEGQCFPVTHR